LESEPIPSQVREVLESTSIGYLTTISKKGDLYSYPVAYYYSDLRVYFVTPVSAAKYKMIKENPTVSLIVDNKQLTTNACGAMIQGRARTFSITRTILSILSVGPKVAGFSKKYPGMLTFYAKGKGLPDERKLYKYRIIQIDPTKILYWIGYNFGRYIPKQTSGIGRKLALRLGKSKENSSAVASMIQSADDDHQFETPVDSDWVARLNASADSGQLSEEERKMIRLYKSSKSSLGLGEKDILNRWKNRQ
jgi:Pyridoxamine 5'-phosphate oxidase